jgi:dsDNA-binding SOS-regulon protein
VAVITQYVVQHKGVDKLVTTDKKEADKYDKMLSIADNLAVYIAAKGIELDESICEELSIVLAKNKEGVARLFRGLDADEVLASESADIVSINEAAGE